MSDRPRDWPEIPRDAADALAALVRSSDDAIYSKDAQARITSWNPAAERLYGYTEDEAIGQPISMLVPDHRRGEEIDILQRILNGERVEHFETQRRRKDGQIVEVSVSVSPVHDSEGNVVEAAVIARDVTEHKRMLARLAEAEEAQLALKRKQALSLNDTVVQGLAASKLALEMGDVELGLRALSNTLERAKVIVTTLLREAGDVAPGDLIRDQPAVLEE